MGSVVMVAYTPKANQDAALRSILGRHVKTLRSEGLATKRPSLVLQSRKEGSYVEIFEWASDEASQRAHDVPSVQALWKEMQEAADIRPVGSLEEAGKLFAHFDVVEELGA